MAHLRDLFYSHEGRLIHKWDHYFEIYEKYFEKYRGKSVNILEIGISHGGSIELWHKYFGEGLSLFSVDINEECKKFEDSKTKVFIGSQDDPVFLQNLIKELPDLDIIIDDGGHTMSQQIVSFEYLYPKVKEGGIYMVEDTHTSYWFEYGGGYKKKGSFIEYSKNVVDILNEGHINNKSKLPFVPNSTDIYSVSFYDSIVVFEKNKRPAPFHLQKGIDSIAPYVEKSLKKRSLFRKALDKITGYNQSTFGRNFKGKFK